MAILDEFAELASAVVEAFDNGVGGGTGGAALSLGLRSGGTYAPSTGKTTGATDTDYAITRWVRSRSLMSVIPAGGGGMRKVEEFSVLVTRADLTAAGLGASVLPDEKYDLTVGTEVYPIVRAEREAGEKLVRLVVRRDLGPAV